MSLVLPRTREEKAMKLIWEAFTDEQKKDHELYDALVHMLNVADCDDAIHIAAPWEPRSSLCGNWNRNLVSLGDPRPDGMSGCWTCIMASEWFEKHGRADS